MYTEPDPHTGIISWFARNPVAANLLMVMIIAVGGIAFLTMTKEAQPRIPPRGINVTIPFPGAAPEEVEQAILIKLEAALKDVDGIESFDTYANEGSGSASIDVDTGSGYDIEEVMKDVEQAVAGMNRLPAEAEKPRVTANRWQQSVLRVQISGDLDERSMKALAEEVRDDLLQIPQVAKATVRGVRPTEISIEIPERQLRRYGLSLNQVSNAVRSSSTDLSGGSIESDSGDIRIRAIGQAYNGEEFEQIVLLTRPDGTRITIGDIAVVKDEFVDMPFYTLFNGRPSVSVEVDALGDQSQIEVSAAARQYIVEKQKSLPPGVTVNYWGDISVFIGESVNLMVKNLLIGSVLVFIVLGLFLRLQLAAWVMMGIPVSFLGAGMLMPLPGFDLTVNMMSIFGFFMVLGIVVDDAIIIGESAYTEVEKHGQHIDNVIIGVKRVVIPATFGVLTTIATFTPLIVSGGDFAAMQRVIGWVVVFCLIFSIVESKLILPAHLAHIKAKPPGNPVTRGIHRVQDMISAGLKSFVSNQYQPFLKRAIEHRYTTVTTFIALLIIVGGMFMGGIIRFVFSPEIPDTYAMARVELAEGMPEELGVSIAEQLRMTLVQAGDEIQEELGLEESLLGDNNTVLANSTIDAAVEINQPDSGDVDPKILTDRWRELMGDVAGTKSMRIRSMQRTGGGPALQFSLLGRDSAKVEAAAADLIEHLRGYTGVYEVESSHVSGTRELQLRIKPQAEALGLTQMDLASQVRQAFYGVEAQRVNRDDTEIRVMVRYPKEERISVGNLENMWFKTPAGGEVPFEQVALMVYDAAPSGIRRQNGERVVVVTAEVNTTTTAPGDVMRGVYQNFVAKLPDAHPGVNMQLSGASERQNRTLFDFGKNALIALFVIYALMAIPLKSYIQPLIVMSVIPFGLIGALLGHFILNYPVSSVTIMGLIALTGVVVNDGIILVDYVNKAVAQGRSRAEAAVEAGGARFRAILLTSTTTFMGLTPMLTETSFQAALMMPMAIALAFGILFATTMTLILIPCLYIIADDFMAMIGTKYGPAEGTTAQPSPRGGG